MATVSVRTKTATVLAGGCSGSNNGPFRMSRDTEIRLFTGQMSGDRKVHRQAVRVWFLEMMSTGSHLHEYFLLRSSRAPNKEISTGGESDKSCMWYVTRVHEVWTNVEIWRVRKQKYYFWEGCWEADKTLVFEKVWHWTGFWTWHSNIGS